MRYYISDLHFYHGNLNEKMDCRGFDSTECMNEYMISQWNSRVRKNDEVVILGDFCISTKPDDLNNVIHRLKGKKYLIVGNHDKYLSKSGVDTDAFEWIELDRKRKCSIH